MDFLALFGYTAHTPLFSRISPGLIITILDNLHAAFLPTQPRKKSYTKIYHHMMINWLQSTDSDKH